MKNGRKIKVVDFHSLELEKIRLMSECKMMELELELKMTHLREHYGSMALHSIFPKSNGISESLSGKARDLVSGFLGNSAYGTLAFNILRKGIKFLVARQVIRSINPFRKK